MVRRLRDFLSIALLFSLISCQVVTISTEQYKVEFIDTVSSAVMDTKMVQAGNKVEPIANPSKTYYKFDDWTDDKQNHFDFDNYVVLSNTKVYAQWIPFDQIRSVIGSVLIDGEKNSTITSSAEENVTYIEFNDSVVLNEADSGTTVYYTLDGSDPAASETRSVYSGAITPEMLGLSGDKTVTIRTYAEKEGNIPSKETKIIVSLKKYTVTLNSNTGSEDDSVTKTVYSGETVAEPETPVWAEHIFLGWYLDDANVYDFSKVISYLEKESFILTAKWKEYGTLSPITVRKIYDANETAVETGSNPVYYEYQDTISLSCASAADDSGCEIYYTLDGSDPKTNGIKYDGSKLTLAFADKDEPVVLKAYSKKALMKDSDVFTATFVYRAYTVTVDPRIDKTDASKESEKLTLKVYSGEKLVQEDIEQGMTLVSEDYKFLGWYVDSSAYDFDKEIAYLEDESFNLDAKWQEIGVQQNVNVRYDGKNFQVEKNTIVELYIDETADGADFAKIYYTLDGTDPVTQDVDTPGASAIEYKSESPIVIASDTTVKAAVFSTKLASYKHSSVTTMQFTLKEYTVSFAGNDVDIENQTVKSGSCVTKPEDPVSSVNNFEGWVDSDGNDFDFETAVYSKLILTAKWSAKPVLSKPVFTYDGSDYLVDKGETVTLNIDAGSTGADKAVIWYTTDGTNPLVSETKIEAEGKTVSFEINGTTQIRAVAVSTVSSYLNSDETSVVFGLKKYTVSFDMNGATSAAPSAQTVSSGSCAEKPASVNAYPGYNFVSWCTDKDGSTEFNFASEIRKDVTLYANWEEAPVTKPDAVSNLSITGNDRIYATWTNPTNDSLTKIIVTVTDADDNVVETRELEGTATEYIYTPSALGNYTVSIVAVGSTGLESDPAAAVVKYYTNTLGTLNRVDGDTNPPKFTTLFSETLLIHSTNSSDTNVWLPIVCDLDSVTKGTESQTSNSSNVIWYTSSDGKSWDEVTKSDTNSFEWAYTKLGILMMRFNASAIGSRKYFSVKVVSKGGSSLVSNSCYVEYGTTRANMVGYYYYSDDTYSSSYDESKTILGLVCDVDTNNVPSRIVAVKDASTGARWAPEGTTGYARQYLTTIDDGAMNWKVVSLVDSTGASNASVKYPAFNACNEFTTGNLNWYLPGSGELIQLCANKGTFNSVSNGFTQLPDAQYWSSTDVGSSMALMFNFKDGYTNANSKSTANCVRAIAKVSPSGSGSDAKTATLTATVDATSGYSIYFVGTFTESSNWAKAVEGAWGTGNVWTATVHYTGDSFTWKTIKAKSDATDLTTNKLESMVWDTQSDRTYPSASSCSPSY